jgi:hypothetical protein
VCISTHIHLLGRLGPLSNVVDNEFCFTID